MESYLNIQNSFKLLYCVTEHCEIQTSEKKSTKTWGKIATCL